MALVDHRVADKLFNSLVAHGPCGAGELMRGLGVSQATLSRILTNTSLPIARLGRARATEYGLYEAILGLPAVQPLHWVTAEGQLEPIGELHHLARGTLAWSAGSRHEVFRPEARKSALPWQFAPWLLRGFLGRRRVVELTRSHPALPSDQERWSTTEHVFAALAGEIDSRGAILVGEDAPRLWADTGRVEGIGEDEIPTAYDRLAQDQIANGLPGKSSADGEQPKFVCRLQRASGVVECLIKFSAAPADTPVGRRWQDLLLTESIASEVLADNGYSVPKSRLIVTRRHTFLESERLDRQGRRGRRHMIPLANLHEAFVPGSIQNWVSSVKYLALQKRIDAQTVDRVQRLYVFGGLIGNSDMHAGNLSFYADSPEALRRRRFRLAPCYDMLSMRWAPVHGVPPEYTPFDASGRFAVVDAAAVSGVTEMARDFFQRLSANALASTKLRAIAKAQIKRLVLE